MYVCGHVCRNGICTYVVWLECTPKYIMVYRYICGIYKPLHMITHDKWLHMITILQNSTNAYQYNIIHKICQHSLRPQSVASRRLPGQRGEQRRLPQLALEALPAVASCFSMLLHSKQAATRLQSVPSWARRRARWDLTISQDLRYLSFGLGYHDWDTSRIQLPSLPSTA